LHGEALGLQIDLDSWQIEGCDWLSVQARWQVNAGCWQGDRRRGPINQQQHLWRLNCCE
jgi:hypothetical protein